MNKKGQSIGLLLVAAVALIVGLVLFQVIAQQIGTTTNTVDVNMDITAPANGGVYNFTDYRALNSVTITDVASGITIGEGNYTIANNQIVNGNLATTLTVDDAQYAGNTWNIVATGQPLTYVPNGGSRAAISLILIFFALMLVAVALEPTMRSGLLKAFRR